MGPCSRVNWTHWAQIFCLILQCNHTATMAPNDSVLVDEKMAKSSAEDHDTGTESLEALQPQPLDRKLQFKIDVRLIPILGLTYTIMFLDRTNSMSHPPHPAAFGHVRWRACFCDLRSATAFPGSKRLRYIALRCVTEAFQSWKGHFQPMRSLVIRCVAAKSTCRVSTGRVVLRRTDIGN